MFSIFDPVSFGFLMSNWYILFYVLGVFPFSYWLVFSLSFRFWSLLYGTLYIDFKASLVNSNFPFVISFLFGLFMFVLCTNFVGLFPYLFTSSSHMVFCMTLAIPFWFSPLLMLIFCRPLQLFSHLVPYGTPGYLMVFMVFIETISLLIRPLTLSVRLTANMVAGHLLITLLNSAGDVLLWWTMIWFPLISMLLMFLETAVAVIQAYVFVTLLSLYISEIN